ncbi:peptidase M48-like protein [Hoylesella shahii DSM 15611 = JCM 12083]|jgi:M48 family peptidase|uniref:Peptidase M48-like protein n=2 Tax=Hoylesella shahii TaxID=228603 RepID=A0A318I0F4_9BACT|nr:peptidase M48-like protein [Hoylesella shahii DSM 15611 = JCM 12083]
MFSVLNSYLCATIRKNVQVNMKRFNYFLISALAALMLACGTSSKVPITGRKHSLLVSDSQILSLSKQEYSKFLSSAKLSSNAANTAMVKRVGQRLAKAVETYLVNNGYQDELKNFEWEFNLVADNQVNAFCMPGGKIVVYEGLLPVSQDEASLAIVLGHEIAHAVAKHSAEQMSKKMRQAYGTQIGGSILGAIGGQTVGDIAQIAAGQYFSFRNLKYSRDNESEADHMGLIFAAMAGYDPSVAVGFWQRMAAKSGNSNGSDMFSDHPSDAKRIAAIQQLLPEAMAYYKAATQSAANSSTNSNSNKANTKPATKNKGSKSVSASDLYRKTKSK